MAADAVQHLRAAILAGRLAPGERIVERPVAEELGISSIAVRDAFARLTLEGWIERQPRRGVRVRRLEPHELDDVGATRSLLEGQAAALAAGRIAHTGDGGLAEIPPAMRRAARRGDRTELLALDDAFHAALWRLSGSPILEELLLNLRARITPLVRLALEDMSRRELAAMEGWHAELLTALYQGEGDARQAAVVHADRTRDRVCDASRTA